MRLTQAPYEATPNRYERSLMLREIPESMQEGESDFARWFFETQREQWEEEQRAEDERPTIATTEEKDNERSNIR